MKKLISLLLTLIMVMSLVVPAAYAVDEKPYEPGYTPIIYLRGNGEAIHYDNGAGEEAKIDIPDVLGDESIYDVEGMKKEIVNILIPFVMQGLPLDEWDECRKAIYNAISPFFIQSAADSNGNAQMGTTISKAAQNENANPKVKTSGPYSTGEYTFHYDWRRDPYDNVKELHKYIELVLKNTNKTQVSIVSRCLGGTLLNAYLEQYGELGHVKNVVYCDTLGNGSTVLSKFLSGKVSIDGKNTQRYLGQLEQCAELGVGMGFSLPGFIDEVITTTLDLFTQTNVTDLLGDGLESLYNELLQMLLPALMHAVGYATTPNYWACVRDEDFDDAVKFMFGEEDSEAYTYYAGLIAKIKNYNEKVSSKLPGLLTTFVKEYGIHIGNVSKYGYINVPATEDNDLLSDALTSLPHATFGATCAKVGEKLSDSDIAGVDNKYISPDKQVNLSTSVLADTTWVLKNCHHDYATIVFKIADEFCNANGMTVETSSYPRFMMYDEVNDAWSEMTEDNCADYEFISRVETEPTVITKLVSGLRFLTMIFKLIARAVSGEISFDALGKLFG